MRHTRSVVRIGTDAFETKHRTKNGAVLDVRYPQCVVPDTFRDRPEAEVGVTAEGRLQRDGSFEATQIMAKCPSKYEEKNGKKTPVGMADNPGM